MEHESRPHAGRWAPAWGAGRRRELQLLRLLERLPLRLSGVLLRLLRLLKSTRREQCAAPGGEELKVGVCALLGLGPLVHLDRQVVALRVPRHLQACGGCAGGRQGRCGGGVVVVVGGGGGVSKGGAPAGTAADDRSS